jgi:oligoendopeptidase F
MSHRLAQARWSLHELLPGPAGPALDRHLARLEAAVAEIEATRAGLSPDSGTPEFLDLLHWQEVIAGISSRLGAYAYLWFVEDTQNPLSDEFKWEWISVPQYLKILAYRDSEPPTAILAEAELNVASPAFWQGGFDLIEEFIEELEAVG